MLVNSQDIYHKITSGIENNVKNLFHSGFDANERVNPLVEGSIAAKPPSQDGKVLRTAKRIARIAVPFICMYKPAGAIVNAVLMIGQIKVHVQNKEYGRVAWVVTVVALSVLIPPAGVVLSHGTVVISSLYQAAVCFPKNKKESLLHVGTAFLSTAYIVSAIIPTPETIAISLISQAIFELYKGYKLVRDNKGDAWDRHGNKIEAIAQVALAAIRVYQAAPQIDTSHRNWFGKKLTKSDLDQILTKRDETKTLDFEKELINRRISSRIDNVSFSDKYIEDATFKNMSFKNCNFKGTVLNKTTLSNVDFDTCSFKDSYFKNTVFSKVSFSKANLLDAIFAESSLSNTTFTDSSLQNTTFYMCALSAAKISNSNLFQASFNNSSISNSTIDGCKLNETSFFHAKVVKTSLNDCDLTDTLLTTAKDNFTYNNCTEHKMTKPVVALAWDFRERKLFTGYIRESLVDCKATVLRVHYYPEDIDQTKMDQNVRDLLKDIEANPSKNSLSIGSEILKRAKTGSEVEKIKNIASDTAAFADALFIPGGEDIEPELYGAAKYTESSTFNKRTLLELAFFAEGDIGNKPVMGVCRGSQLGNIYYGGDLYDHVEGHLGKYQHPDVNENADPKLIETVKGLIGDSFVSYSCHHQASKKIGKNLEVILQYQSDQDPTIVPKLMMSKDGKTILSQIHPEYYITISNFINASKKQIPKMEGIVEKYNRSGNNSQTDFYQFLEQHSDEDLREVLAGQFKSVAQMTQYIQRLKDLIDNPDVKTLMTSNRNIYSYFIDKVNESRNRHQNAAALACA